MREAFKMHIAGATTKDIIQELILICNNFEVKTGKNFIKSSLHRGEKGVI